MADLADKHELYQRSVQCPEADITFFDRVFRRHRKRKPLSMKEDFCGTALLCCEWVKTDRRRTALGVDLHGPTLRWARENNVERLEEAERARVELIQSNVLEVTRPKVDFTGALNFSYCVFKTRAELREYFEVARRGLVDDGMFFCELYGGTEAIVELEERRRCRGFTYVWHQEKYNPIDHHTLCHIHFEFPDGSRMERAFTYDWRLWTIPEVREVLYEAGFSKVELWWDPVDGDPKGDTWYRRTEEEENQLGWLVYFAALR
jgi:hypothetical protein